jgi:hypothetical protein
VLERFARHDQIERVGRVNDLLNVADLEDEVLASEARASRGDRDRCEIDAKDQLGTGASHPRRELASSASDLEHVRSCQ